MLSDIFSVLFIVACVPVIFWCTYLEKNPGRYEEAWIYTMFVLAVWVGVLLCGLTMGTIISYLRG